MSTAGGAAASAHNRKLRRSSSTTANRSSSAKDVILSAASNRPHPSAPNKRPALANITNNHRPTAVPCSTKIVTIKKAPPPIAITKPPSTQPVAASSFLRPTIPPASSKVAFSHKTHVVLPPVDVPMAPKPMDLSPSASSDALSVSMDESMSTCDSLKSPDIEYLDTHDVAAVDSLEKKTSRKLCISDNIHKPGILCKRDILSSLSPDDDDDVVDLDHDLMDTQACATIACDIYKHLRASEEKKRPSIDFMERVQKDINPSMRAILIDWLVEVAEEYRLVPETLYLTVNYIDRYLSGNVMDRQRLQLLGVACMMIASKYEEICAPQVEEFCYITDNTYFKDEVLEMESAVLNYLKFEMTAPTTKCFLRRFVRAAQGLAAVHDSLQLECLVNLVAELSLLEYSMLRYRPSLIAASAIFLAKYILSPTKRPWNSTLRHYTQYEACELRDCVLAMHSLCCNNQSSSLPAIREKYSQHKYKFVAKKYCPPTIAAEMFEMESSSSC